MMEIYTIHGEFLGVLQEVDLGLSRTHAPGHSSLKKQYKNICYLIAYAVNLIC